MERSAKLTHRFRDRNPVKYPYAKSDWMDPVPELTESLIARHLDLLRLGLYESSEPVLGTLKFSLGIATEPATKQRTLTLKLKSIYEVKQLAGEQR